MWFIRIYICMVIGVTGIRCVDVLTSSVCYGNTFDNYRSISCNDSEVILVRDVRAMAKLSTTGCPVEETSFQAAEESCCVYEADDCGGSYSGSAFRSYYDRCHGEQTCRQLQASWEVTSEKFPHCDADLYIARTNYMIFEYSCVDSNTISEPCSTSSVTGSSVYLWNAGYPLPMDSSSAQCTCSVEASCKSQIKVTVIDLRFETSTSGCLQRLTLADTQQSRNITCDDNNNFRPVDVFTSNDYFLTMNLLSDVTSSSAYFWIEVTGLDSAEFTLNCEDNMQTQMSDGDKPECSGENSGNGTNTDGSSGNGTNTDGSSGNETNTDGSSGNGTNTDGSSGNGTNTDGSSDNVTSTDSSSGNGTNTDSSSGNGTNTDDSSGNGTNTDGSSGNGANTDDSSGNGTNTDGSSGNGTNTDGSSSNGTNTDGSSGNGTNTDGSSGNGTNTDGSSGNGTNTDSSSGNGTNTDGSSGNGSNTDGSSGNGTNTGVNSGNGTNTDGSSGNGTNTDGSSGNGTNTDGSSGNGTNTDGSSGNGTNTDGSSGNGTNTDGSSGNGTNTDGSSGNGTNTDGSSGNGTNTDGSFGNGTNTDGSSGNGTNTDGSSGNGTNTDGSSGNGTNTDGTYNGNKTIDGNSGGTDEQPSSTSGDSNSILPIVIAVILVGIFVILGIIGFLKRKQIKERLCPDGKVEPDDDDAVYDSMPNPLFSPGHIPLITGAAAGSTMYPGKGRTLLHNADPSKPKSTPKIDNPALISPAGQPASHLPPLKFESSEIPKESVLNTLIKQHGRYEHPVLNLGVGWGSGGNTVQTLEEKEDRKKQKRRRKKKNVLEKLKKPRD